MMTIFDDFTDNGQYFGEKKEYPNEANVQRFIADYGIEWLSGYLIALEAVAVDISEILHPDHICGIPQTPHMVKVNLQKYWSHNKSLFLNISSKIEPPKNDSNKPIL
jgi:hypothetical protein